MARRDGFGEGNGASRDEELMDSAAPDGVADISSLLHDDEFLSALAQGSVADDVTAEERELADLLLQWREEVIAAPLPEAPTVDEIERELVVAPVTHISSRRPRRMRWLTSVAGAAAAAAFVVGGVAVVSQNAQPGDPLWGVRQAIHGSDSTTVLVAGLRSDLEQAEQALESGDVDRAKDLLDSVASQLSTVGGPQQTELSNKLRTLSERAEREGGRTDVAPVTTTPKRTSAPEVTQPRDTSPVELPTFTLDPDIMRTVPLPPITQIPLPPYFPEPTLPVAPPPPVTIPPEILDLPLDPPPPVETTAPEPTQPPADSAPTTTLRVPTSLQPTTTQLPEHDIPSILDQLPLLPDDPRLR
ncbi:anti-sigma-D factor RsdA [Hoyosella sp. YIM 151337]|uniref:anti-sigma-D factor RsdA n=1 Tax=Hoyosella sp. YIM 151337 TaxID=2992742 RepID=UPI0022366973|nr:anti-sigma-D factor RsdA [Hoyosella sp. YIM 151337]MCW4352505.1 anti-sigma-D factor RsdA [Hoyosella sp. YIM 151337]